MSGPSPQNLIEAYGEWLKEQMSVEQLQSGALEISTPFLDRHNDQLQIYVEPSDRGFRLTDDGYILADLEMCGCPIDTPRRESILKSILQGFGVKNQDGRLTVETSPATFPQKKHSLLQAMLAVNDMFMTSKRWVATLFLEDVASYLAEAEIRSIKHVSVPGRTGMPQSFDFAIPQSSQAPERFVNAVNELTKSNVSTLLFSWTDTKPARDEDSRFYVFLNDEHQEPDPTLIAALEEYEVRPVRWTQRERYLRELAA